MTRRKLVLVFLLYAMMAVVATSPVSLSPGKRVSYEGDALLNAFILAHSAPMLFTHPSSFWNLPAFVPYDHALAFSEHLLFPSLLSWPIRVLSGNPLLAHNLVVLLFLALSAFFMFLLVQRLTGSVGASLTAGALFAFNTFIVNEIPRLQLQAQCFFPLAFLLMIRQLERPRWRTAAAFSVVVLVCGLSNNYYQLYLPLLLGLALPLLATQAPAAKRVEALRELTLSIVPTLVVFGVLAREYLSVASRFSFTRDLPSGIPLQMFLATRPENWLYGETVAGVRYQIQAAHFTGFVPIALALVAFVFAVRQRSLRAQVALSGVGVVLFVLLSAGSDIVLLGHRLAPGPYRLLHAFVPGFNLVRIPERLGVLAVFWLALLAGYGAAFLLAKVSLRWRVGAAVGLTGFVFLEHLSTPVVHVSIPTGSDVPEVYRFLRDYPARRVAEIPFNGPWLNRLDALNMYYAIGSKRAIVNGYTGYYPPAYAFLRYKLSSDPGPFFLETIERLGLDHLVVHPHLWEPDRRAKWLDFLARQTERLRRVRELPQANARTEPAWDHGGEIIYQVLRPGARVPSPTPLRRPVPARSSWSITASHGAYVRNVLDGDPITEWRTGLESTAGCYLELRFGEEIEIAGVRFLLTFPFSGYPGRLDVSVRRPDGKWRLQRFDRDRADRELLARLLASGHDAWYHVDFAPVVANGVRLVVAEADPMLEEWRVAELEVYQSS